MTFQNHINYFRSISDQKREDWINKMFVTEQFEEEPPKLFLDDHEEPTNPFSYKEWTLNYHKV